MSDIRFSTTLTDRPHPAQGFDSHLAERPAVEGEILAGGGEMGAMMRSFDWMRTPFGSVESWPQSLRTAVSIMLASRFAMVVAWGSDFRFLYNDRYRPILGASKHPGALGTPGREIFPEIWHIIGPLFEQAAQGEAVAFDDIYLPLDRYGYLENCWFTLSYSPIRDETGGVGGILAVVAETTERVQSERRLRTLRELARRAADAKTVDDACRNAMLTFGENRIDIPFALLYLVDPDGNQARLASCTGIPSGMAASRAQIDLTAAASDSEWPVTEVLASRQPRVFDDLQRRFGPLPGGDYAESTHTALLIPMFRPGQKHPDGVLIFGVCPRRALDEQYRTFFELASDQTLTGIRNALAYQEERERAEKLAELDRAKTIFFNNVSHEFRTPLTLMLGPLEELLDSNNSLSSEHRAQLAVTHRNSLRLLKLVNTLLDFSRIEAGRIGANFEPTDLPSFTCELCGVFRAAVEKAGLELVTLCPAFSQPVYVDHDMWEKIVLNLLSNALKFTFHGQIAVELRESATTVLLSVRDTGIGIPDYEVGNLFKRFHRVEGARGRTFEGTGIGLALVQELVKLHGGSITVKSQLGRGTQFDISIPLGHAHLPQDRVRSTSTAAPTTIKAQIFKEEALGWLPDASPPGTEPHSPTDSTLAASLPLATQGAAPLSTTGQARVLVADDNADMREYLRRLLATRYDVSTVPDGIAALAAAHHTKPDLILSDVMMPQLDGFGLLRRIRMDPQLRTTPVILLSARAGEESRVDGLQVGADDYLIKPFSARELMARVESHLKMAALRREALERESRLREQVEAEKQKVQEAADKLHSEAQKTQSELIAHKKADKALRRAQDELVELNKDLERRVEERTTSLREAVAQMEEFSYSVSHDLRSPVRAMQGYAKALLEDYGAGFDRRGHEYLQRIMHSSARMERLIHDVLTYSRASRTDIKLQPISLDMLVRGIVRQYPEFDSDRADIFIQANLPTVLAHEPSLGQAIANLLNNAVKFVAPGVRPNVHITAERNDHGLILRIKDNGIGIKPQHQHRLFGMFERIHPSDRYEGTGIGLAIVRKTIERMGGKVGVESDGVNGSTFWIQLTPALGA